MFNKVGIKIIMGKYSKFLLLPIFASAVFISGCASQPKSAVKKIFVTNISVDGIKSFSFSLIRDRSQKKNYSGKGRGSGSGVMGSGMGGGKGKMSGGHSGKNGGGDNFERLKIRTENELVVTLDETGYCRDGYSELESYFVQGVSQIRGECYDDANEDDRQKFINI